MLRKYLADDAFLLPAKKTVIDYSKLYQQEQPFYNYLCAKASDSDQLKKQYIVECNKFKKQFNILIDHLILWGKHNFTANERLNSFKNLFFNEEYSGNQEPQFFAAIKKILEEFIFILRFDINNSATIEAKKYAFDLLIKNITVCSPGLYSHFESSLYLLKSEASIENWLTECRTNIVYLYGEKHIQKYNIEARNSSHAHIAFEIHGIKQNWGIRSTVTNVSDPFKAHAKITNECLKELETTFTSEYHPKAIVDSVTVNFGFELNKIRKVFSLEEKDGWTKADPDYVNAVTHLANSIHLNMTFFDFSEDYQSAKFNIELFKVSFLQYCQNQKRIFKSEMWASIGLDDCKFHYLQETQLYWFLYQDSPHTWETLQKIADPKKILGNALTKLSKVEISTLFSVTKIDLSDYITSSVDLADLIINVAEKTPIEDIVNLYLSQKYTKSLLQSKLDLFEFIYTLPTEHRWKAKIVCDLCNIKLDFDYNKQSDSLSLLNNFLTQQKLSAKSQASAAAKRGYAVTIKVLLENKKIKTDQVYQNNETLLHIAAQHGRDNVIKVLAENKADLNSHTKYGWTPLHYAAKYNKTETAKTLLELKADVNAVNSSGTTTAHIATEKNNAALMQELIEYKADLTLATKKGLTVAYKAVHYNKINVLRILVKAKVNFSQDKSDEPNLLRSVIASKQWTTVALIRSYGSYLILTPSHLARLAIAKGDLQTLQILIELQFNINEADREGNNLLHHAAKINNQFILKLIHETYPKLLAIKNHHDELPCHIAIDSHYENAKYLYSLHKNTMSLAHFAVQDDNVKLIKEIVESKDSLDDLDITGNAPIHVAASNNHVIAMEELAEQKVDLGLLNFDNLSAAQLAVTAGHIGIISILARHAVDFTLAACETQSPIALAIQTGQWMMAASMFQLNPENEAEAALPLHLAIKRKHINAVQILLEYPALVTAKDGDQNNPAHIAAYEKNSTIIELLLNKHIKLFKEKNSRYRTPFDIALSQSDFANAEIIRAHSKDSSHISLMSWAVLGNNPGMIKKLAEQKYDPNACNKLGYAPIHQAVINELPNVIIALVEAKADINIRTPLQQTPAHLAIALNHNLPTLQTLVASKADLALQDNTSKTPLQLASSEEMPQIALALCETAKKTSDLHLLLLITNYHQPTISVVLNTLHEALKEKDWNTAVKILTSCKAKQIINSEDEKLIRANKINLTNAFITLAKSLTEDEKNTLTLQVIQSQNHLGIILNTHDNIFSLFYYQTLQNKESIYIQKIRSELDYLEQEEKHDTNQKRQKII